MIGGEWSEIVSPCISNEYGFRDAEVKYHHNCQVMFYAGKLHPIVIETMNTNMLADLWMQKGKRPLNCYAGTYVTVMDAKIHSINLNL